MDDVLKNGNPFNRNRYGTVPGNRFAGWFLSILIHLSVLLVIFSTFTGQLGILPASQDSDYRHVGIMLLPSEKSEENKVDQQLLNSNKADEKPDEKSDRDKTDSQPSENPHPVQLDTSKPEHEIKEKPLQEKKSDKPVPVLDKQPENKNNNQINSQQKSDSSQSNSNQPNTTESAEGSPSSDSESLPGSLEKNETIFFGLKDKGVRFVYLIDISASMDGIAIERVKKEMIASLKHLDASQSFQIFFFNQKVVPLALRRKQYAGMYRADRNNQLAASKMINTLHTDGGTRYLPVINRALGLNPDVIFLLTDAREPVLSVGQLHKIHKMNRGQSRIHTIEFGKIPEPRKSYNFLSRLSSQNNGKYRYYHVTK